MKTVDESRMRGLLSPYAPDLSPDILQKLGLYLELLVKWNDRTNLTAIREPDQMVTRHFGESLFAARHLPSCTTLLDLGSGAGFPGIPMQLLLPQIRVTLAESQNKKAAFLREVVRTLGLETEVWAGRAEAIPRERQFDVVTMRAVDNPEAALEEARRRLAPGGSIAWLTTVAAGEIDGCLPIPGNLHGVIKLLR